MKTLIVNTLYPTTLFTFQEREELLERVREILWTNIANNWIMNCIVYMQNVCLWDSFLLELHNRLPSTQSYSLFPKIESSLLFMSKIWNYQKRVSLLGNGTYLKFQPHQMCNVMGWPCKELIRNLKIHGGEGGSEIASNRFMNNP